MILAWFQERDEPVNVNKEFQDEKQITKTNGCKDTPDSHCRPDFF
jgi:hypothetical protein